MFCVVFVCALLPLQAHFIPKRGGSSGAFIKQVQHFETFRRSHSLDTIRGWKYYKRWEHEQLLHSGSFGMLPEPEDYHQALLEAADRKERSRSLFDNDSWTCIGPFNRPTPDDSTMQNGMGRVNCIAFHPTDSSVYYVGVAQGGVWKTTDDGKSWRALTDNLPIIRISDIAVDPINPSTIYIALGDYEYIQFGMLQYGRKRNTYFGIGIYKSIDGGEHWKATGLGRSLYQGEASLMCRILIHPTQTNRLLAAGTTGFFTSNDGGDHWVQRDSSLAWDLVADPSNSETVYATAGHLLLSGLGRAGILKSSNFGQSWRRLNSGIPERDSVERIKIAISPSNPTVLYAIATNAGYGMYAFYRSTDAGEHWTMRCRTPNVLDAYMGANEYSGQGSYDLCMMVNAQNPDEVYVGGINVWGSSDGGLSFRPIAFWTGDYGRSIHADHHYMSYRSLTSDYYICNDGGVVRSKKLISSSWDSLQAGKAFKTLWTDVTKNMSITSFYRVISSHIKDNRLAAGAQDNATTYIHAGMTQGVIGGDGMDSWICPTDTQSFIGSWQYGAFARTLDGRTYEGFRLNSEYGDWTAPIVGDYSGNGHVYAAAVNVFRSTDKGLNWKQLSSFAVDTNSHTGQEACALAVCHSDTRVMMVARRLHIERKQAGSVYRSSDGGASWTNVSKGLPDSLFLTSLEVADDNPLIAWASFAGLVQGLKVYRTEDGGESWQNISYDLPNLPVNCVRVIPQSQHHLLMVGTDVGIFVTNDSSTRWASYSTSLPNVIVSDIDVNPATGLLTAATFGRGMWQTEMIYDMPPLAGIEEQELANGLQLYPVPLTAGSMLHFKWDPDCSETVYVELSDSRGKLLHRMQSQLNSGGVDAVLDIPLRPGSYFLRCRCSHSQALQKFVVH